MTYADLLGLLDYIVPLGFGLLGAAFASLYFAYNRGSAELGGVGGNDDGSRWQGKGLFLKLFGWLVAMLGDVISGLPLGESRAKLQKKLTQAGYPGGLSPDEFHAARIVGTVLFTLVGMFLDSELEMTPIIMISFFCLGLVYPDIWLKGTIDKRVRRIFRDLPDMLDTLRLSMDAGLDFGSAIKVVVEHGRKGPLLDELEKVERDMSLGRTRADSFRQFAARLAMTEINAFVLALIQADQLGASIAPVLYTQSDVSRTRRWQLAEAHVNRLPMKMLGPLVVFIFPASFLVLFTPLVIQYMQAP